MSGDTPTTLEALWTCPFCGEEVIEIETINQNAVIKYDTGREVKALVLRVRCKDSLNDSVDRKCPAMSECGCYDLHIYPDGTCHAYYY
jgi:hypothetical protein